MIHCLPCIAGSLALHKEILDSRRCMYLYHGEKGMVCKEMDWDRMQGIGR